MRDTAKTSPNATTAPRHTNRLIDVKSPYLLQHAHNPVDWYPWGEEAVLEPDAAEIFSFHYAFFIKGLFALHEASFDLQYRTWATAFICKNGTCKLPTTDPATLAKTIAERSVPR